MIAPDNNAELDNGCYDPSDTIEWDFDWSDVDGATQYRIQVVRTGATDPLIDTVNDESGNELNGTVNGAILTTDRFNNESSAYMFNGNDSDITVSHDALLNISDQISLIAWIYPISQKTQEIVRKSATINPSVPYALALSATGDIIFSASPNGQFTQVRLSGYSLNNWSFIAGTYDGNAMNLYVNGELVSSTSITGELNLNSGPLLIGTRLNLPADTFHGKLDGIGIYNRALTDNEITALYEAP